ncbi:VOC family protein [Streptomyces sp. SBT349]|uniref:VOC family protein n=1 Tax=Streptomyces sp. SBT349 TaxID=1580539 RepID=UPI00066ED499|nr:VOC family protein [Streptomyces sp. SBT349]
MGHLSLVTLLVPDYDEAIAYYTGRMGFELREDTPLDQPDAPGKRWVVVAPGPGAQTALLLARAATGPQRERIGDQTGGRVAFFLTTDDVDADVRRLAAAGVSVEQPPRDEPYGRIAVLVDRYGNRWDLLGPGRPGGGPSA